MLVASRNRREFLEMFRGCSLTSFLCLAFLVCSIGRGCSSYKGLFVMTIGTKSHMNFFGSVISTLLENGHQITSICQYEQKPSSNLSQIILPADENRDKFLNDPFKRDAITYLRNKYHYLPQMCVDSLALPQVQKALAEEYDYVLMSLFFTECYLGYFSDHNKVPLIYLSPNNLMAPYSWRFGAPEFLSVSPMRLMDTTYPLSFVDRIKSTVVTVFSSAIISIIDKRHERLSRENKLWSPETPCVWNLQQHASIAIINSVRVLEIPIKVVPPTIIYAGGIHLKSTRPLPKHLDDWVNGSGEDGFIYFSLGTGVKSSHVNEKSVSILLKVFRSLKQRIVWKWDESHIPDLPPNVKILPWVPQQDILAHPKIRLFMTHGGLFSAQESIFYGVPAIGMPVYGDQANNVAQIVSEGWARRVDWGSLTEHGLRSVIIETLTNSSLRETVRRRSRLMRDWPRNPKEEVLFWVEYVVRHDGAKHLQSPLTYLPWYKLYNVDVWLLIVGVFSTLIAIVFLFIRGCFRIISRKLFKVKKE